MLHKNVVIALAIIVFLIVVIFITNRSGTKEKFSLDGSNELDKYYNPALGSEAGIEDDLVDKMVCSPKCCGDTWQVPFDGLTPDEIRHALYENSIENGKNTGFVRTDMTCGNGDGGVGCPCIPTKAYMMIANRGNNSPNLNKVPSTFYIHNDDLLASNEDNDWTPYQKIQKKKSMFVGEPLLNDRYYQRPLTSLKNLQSYGSPVETKNSQLAKVM